MKLRLPSRTFAALALGALSIGLVATTPPADTVRGRIAAYRELGASFKGVNDSLRGGEVQGVVLAQYARQIRNYSRQQYAWFPAGSGQESGARTKARSEIWLKPNDFKAAQDAFARQADAFQRAVQSNNADTIRAGARALGGTCKGCHDNFRQPTD